MKSVGAKLEEKGRKTLLVITDKHVLIFFNVPHVDGF